MTTAIRFLEDSVAGTPRATAIGAIRDGWGGCSVRRRGLAQLGLKPAHHPSVRFRIATRGHRVPISVKRWPGSAMMYETPVITMPAHINSDPAHSDFRPTVASAACVSAVFV